MQKPDMLDKISAVLKRDKISVFEFDQKAKKLTIYMENLETGKEIPDFPDCLSENPRIAPEDLWKTQSFFRGDLRGPIEFPYQEKSGQARRKILDIVPLPAGGEAEGILLGTIRDVTEEKNREELLREQARKDSLTGLYNHLFGKELISQYLERKNPYDSCGMMVMDIDYFKNVNDTYGHLFGDEVLAGLARFLVMFFDRKDIVLRMGGDEFVVFLKDISREVLTRKARQLVEGVRSLVFSEKEYSMTCSVGVCYLPENVSGYTYDQLFSNADWALYRAKENGRNRYAFCDTLRRFESAAGDEEESHPSLDARYLHNDIVATAFEIFEKNGSFDAAVRLLMEVIGMRFHLDRITVVQTNIHEKYAGRQYQWTAPGAPEVLQMPGNFTKEDFLTLFRSYDEYGTTVLQYDQMEMYSPGAAELLMQGEAKTVLYAATYCEGTYTGAVSYVNCGQKRFWSRQSRKEIGELTKIISAHLAKNQAINSLSAGTMAIPERDSLTGLLSFDRFREEAERIIVGGFAVSRLMIYSDFANFRSFNQQQGYQAGDQLLKQYSAYMIGRLKNRKEIYFTRVVADQFILFMPCGDLEEAAGDIRKANAEFAADQMQQYQEMNFHIRTGIYPVTPECESASEAIDAARYAWQQAEHGGLSSVIVYDSRLDQKRKMEEDLAAEFETALKEERFRLYLQPRFSPEDFRVTGADAVVRWERRDGTFLDEAVFRPFLEKNRKIQELDRYVFEKTAAFLAKDAEEQGLRLPVAVTVSVFNARNSRNAEKKYAEILAESGADPSLLELELSETAAARYTDYVKDLFGRARGLGLRTSLGSFGAGSSVWNSFYLFPVDMMKLSGEFIRRCRKNPKGREFLRHTVRTAADLGCRVIAAGVDTEEEAAQLKEAGCEEISGSWLAGPMAPEEFKERMRRLPDGSIVCRPAPEKKEQTV
jgi:diguanylate cyclase (GGDEF)-like protein